MNGWGQCWLLSLLHLLLFLVLLHLLFLLAFLELLILALHVTFLGLFRLFGTLTLPLAIVLFLLFDVLPLPLPRALAFLFGLTAVFVCRRQSGWCQGRHVATLLLEVPADSLIESQSGRCGRHNSQ